MPQSQERDPGPALPEVEMHLHRPTEPATATITESTVCTSGRKAASFVRHVVLDISKTEMAGRYRAGQSFGVIAPGVDEHGKPHKVRLYSIASPSAGEDGKGQTLATTVKRTLDENWDDHRLLVGVASNFLCDAQAGDEVLVTGPAGKRFLLPASPEEHDYVFFATGTGIAPFRGMVRDLLDPVGNSPVESRIVLVMGSPYETDLIYHREFLSLAAKHPNFTYLTAVSRHPQADGSPGMYVQGRLETHADLFRTVLESPRGLVYCCGLAGMELGVFQGMARALSTEWMARYVKIDEGAGTDPASWTRKMIPRELAPTRRTFLEVY